MYRNISIVVILLLSSIITSFAQVKMEKISYLDTNALRNPYFKFIQLNDQNLLIYSNSNQFIGGNFTYGFFLEKYSMITNAHDRVITSTSQNLLQIGEICISPDSSRILISGVFSNEMNFQNVSIIGNDKINNFLIELDSAGNYIRHFVINGMFILRGISYDLSNFIYVTGDFSGDISIGNSHYTCTDSSDGFVGKFGESSIEWSKQINVAKLDLMSNIKLRRIVYVPVYGVNTKSSIFNVIKREPSSQVLSYLPNGNAELPIIQLDKYEIRKLEGSNYPNDNLYLICWNTVKIGSNSLIKCVNPNGELQWSRNFRKLYITESILDSEGNIYLLCRNLARPTDEFRIIKIDSVGRILYNKLIERPELIHNSRMLFLYDELFVF